MSKCTEQLFGHDTEAPITISLILEIHKTAFGHLYDWAGKWRTTNLLVGQFEPPQPFQVPQLMYQFIDNLSFNISIARIREEHLGCLGYTHYGFIRIHPLIMAMAERAGCL